MDLKDKINYTIWCDFCERAFLEDEFQNLLNDKVIYGATSNPAIFQQAICNSNAYTQQINMLQANDSKKIYEELAITDIKRASSIMKSLYEQDSNDGFISLEVDPTLCDDMMGTISEGARLHATIGADNIMIKIPATQAGYGAMENLTAMGINVNATLVFSPTQAKLAAQALDNGIKKSAKDTKGVVSVFISRFDRELDETLASKGLQTAKLGIVNGTQCYYEVEKFQNKNIRTLFASTGVKGDDLKATYYIDNLIFPNTVNTAPLATIKAWIKDGSTQQSEILTQIECEQYFDMLSKHNIDIDQIYNKLLNDGLEAFKISFKELLQKVKL
jgi:transaldolase